MSRIITLAFLWISLFSFYQASANQPLPSPAVDQSYVTSTVFTADTSVAYQSTFNNAIIGIMIDVATGGADLYLTGLTVDVSLCTNFTNDVGLVKVFFTGNDSVYHPDSLYWSGNQVLPGISGSKKLYTGKNYFWLAFNITNYAVENDILDAACNSLTLSDSTGTYTPVITSPAGSRKVKPYIVIPRTISGYLLYANQTGTPLGNVQLLLNSGITVMQTTTNASGYYQFSGLMPGTYYIMPVCVKTWGGVNAVDALAVLRHFVGLNPITGLPLMAADLDISGYINSLDALLVLKRFTGLVDSFPLGDWVFEPTVIIIDGTTNISHDIDGLCTGDINCSFLPN